MQHNEIFSSIFCLFNKCIDLTKITKQNVRVIYNDLRCPHHQLCVEELGDVVVVSGVPLEPGVSPKLGGEDLIYLI